MSPPRLVTEIPVNSSADTRPAAVAVTGLRKSFDGKVVLDGIDLTVPEGTIFALLGPNGAGKTTAVHILSTLVPADGGDIRVAGHDVAAEPDAVRAAIGVTGQFSAVDNLLTGAENLRLMTDLHHLGRAAGQQRAAALLRQFGLEDVAGKQAATYSGGMRRRLDLAMTLAGNPQLIFLDEPTTGLDPRSRRAMWDIIRALAAVGVTIFLTTQYLDEADQLADQVAVLDYGRIVVAGTPAELKRQIPGGRVELQLASFDDLAVTARLVNATARDDDALTLQVPNDGSLEALRGLIDQLDAAAVAVTKMSIHAPDLDDVFFAFTGESGPHQPDPGKAA
jgi:ABC-2 type transport system ATP-binding protein